LEMNKGMEQDVAEPEGLVNMKCQAHMRWGCIVDTRGGDEPYGRG